MKFLLSLALLAAPAALLAQAKPASPAATPAVQISSETFVAKEVTDAKGLKKRSLFKASHVLPGDALVFVLSYENNGTQPATPFVINNAIPKGVIYTGVREPWAKVSVDGGKTFGLLPALKVKNAAGAMVAANPIDVTGVRWSFATPILPKSKGQVMFYAKVQ